MFQNRLVQIIGILAVGYVVLRVGMVAMEEASYMISNFGSWMRWSGIPALFAVAVAAGVAYFAWNLLFGKD